MMRFQRVNGVALGNSNGLPTIQRTPEGIAMGAIPGWVEYIDPDYVNITDKTVRNRARSRAHFPVASAAFDVGAFPVGGEAAFQPTDGRILRIDSAGVEINPSAWSFFAVAHPIPKTDTTDDFVLMRSNAVGDSDSLGFRAVITRGTGSFAVQERGEPQGVGSNPQRLAAPLNLLAADKPSLLMVTFSIRDGLRLFHNTQLAASAPDDKRVIAHGWQAGSRSYFRGCRGYYGNTGILNIDLGWEEHAGYRRAIEHFMMSKYGISA